MFQWRVVSRSNLNGKVHTIQKDFDNYEDYRAFLEENPEYLSRAYLGDWWSPWAQWDPLLPDYAIWAPPADTRYLPDGVDLTKYEKRRIEKRHGEAEKTEKKHSLERNREYLTDYIAENMDDQEAKDDLAKIDTELKNLI